MIPIEAIVDDLVAVISPPDLAFALELEDTENIHEQTLQYFDERDITSSEKLCHWIEKELGKLYVRKILKSLELETEDHSTREMIERWLDFRELRTLRPQARPVELTQVIHELGRQISATPEKFDAVDLLASRLRYLLLYMAYFYADDLVCEQEPGCDEPVEDYVETLEQLDIAELCALIGGAGAVRLQPYAPRCKEYGPLAGDAMQPTLQRVSELIAAGPAQDRACRELSELVIELLDHWSQRGKARIPKGAVVSDCRMTGFSSEATCFDELNECLTVRGLRSAITVGSSLLLCPNEVGTTYAPKLEPVPAHDGWVTPAAPSICSIADIPQARTPRRRRKNVFISYSRKDTPWAERVIDHLKILEVKGITEIWMDMRRLEAGDRWEYELQRALASTKVAILLVSSAFRISDFINQKELPVLLRAADAGKLRLIPLFLKPVYLDPAEELARFQGLNDPGQPLIELTEAEQERMLATLTADVKKHLEGD